jgi:hypothetical protein
LFRSVSGPSRIGKVEPDLRVAELAGVLHGDRVERSLGGWIGNGRGNGGKWTVRIGRRGKRADAAGDIDTRGEDERIRLEDRPDGVQVGGARNLSPAAARYRAARAGDPGVVDQNVEPTETILDIFGRGPDRTRIGDVQGDRADIAAGRAEDPGRLRSASRVSGSQQHGHAQRGELGDNLPPDPPVHPGDQGERALIHIVVGHDAKLTTMRSEQRRPFRSPSLP